MSQDAFAAEFEQDLINLLGDDLLCIVTRPQRWLSPPAQAAEGMLILVWDAAVPRCQQALRRYLAAQSQPLSPVDLVGYSQFEESVQQGMPASVFAAAEGTVHHDPKQVFARLRGLATDDLESVQQEQLARLLQQKGRGHMLNVPASLHRTLAELFLAAEASLHYRWLMSRARTTRHDLLQVSTWDGLRHELELAAAEPQLEERLQAIIDSALSLQGADARPVYGDDIIRVHRMLQKAFGQELA